MKWGAAMKVKTRVAYVATVGEFYNLEGTYIDGLIRGRNTIFYDAPVKQTAFPSIAGPFKKKSLIQRIKEKF